MATQTFLRCQQGARDINLLGRHVSAGRNQIDKLSKLPISIPTSNSPDRSPYTKGYIPPYRPLNI